MKKPVRSDPFVFRGSVSDAGYEWLTGTDGKPRLVPRRVPGTGFHQYELHPALFLEFAKMSATRAEIRTFASVHGDIFNRHEQSVVRHDGTGVHGSSLGTWTREIGDMRVLVELWENIQQRQLSALKKIVRWSQKEVGYILKTPRRESQVTLAHADIPETGLSHFSPKDVLLPARCALQREINLRLAEQQTLPRLTWTPEYHQRIVLMPPNLVAAMWLQFAQAVTGDFRLRVCEGCGKYFQIGPGGRRTDSSTCSGACRQRKSRKSK